MKKVLVLILALFVLGSLIWCWPFYGYVIVEYLGRRSFDSAAWKAGEEDRSEYPVRLRMIDDLLRRQRLVGTSREEVDELLGSPTQTGHFGSYDYVCWVGPERGFIRIDSEWLLMKFAEEKVVEAHVTRD